METTLWKQNTITGVGFWPKEGDFIMYFNNYLLQHSFCFEYVLSIIIFKWFKLVWFAYACLVNVSLTTFFNLISQIRFQSYNALGENYA